MPVVPQEKFAAFPGSSPHPFFLAASSFSRQMDPIRAIHEASSHALEKVSFSKADWALVFASSHYLKDFGALYAECSETLGTDCVVGCSASGILTEYGEINDAPALGVLIGGTSEIRLTPFIFEELEGNSKKIAEKILQLRPEDSSTLVLLPDIFKLDAEPFFKTFNDFNEGNPMPLKIVGGASSTENPAYGTSQFFQEKMVQGGISGFYVRGNFPSRVSVSQACTPISPCFTVTACEGQWLLELDGEPAFEVLKSCIPEPMLDDMRQLASLIFLASPCDNSEEIFPGNFLVQNIVGIDPRNNVLACSGNVKNGKKMAFAFCSADHARENLKNSLKTLKEDCGNSIPQFGIYFNCCARGRALYGFSDVDPSYITQEFNTFPLIGLSSFAEIGPIGQKHFLQAYSGVLVLA
jgi:small ligand-binding sensory domain FIST